MFLLLILQCVFFVLFTNCMQVKRHFESDRYTTILWENSQRQCHNSWNTISSGTTLHAWAHRAWEWMDAFQVILILIFYKHPQTHTDIVSYTQISYWGKHQDRGTLHMKGMCRHIYFIITTGKLYTGNPCTRLLAPLATEDKEPHSCSFWIIRGKETRFTVSAVAIIITSLIIQCYDCNNEPIRSHLRFRFRMCTF